MERTLAGSPKTHGRPHHPAKRDPNQEVACARKLVSDGVVATMADLNIQNAAAVNQVFANAGIPRIGIFAVDISDFSSKDAFPLLAGPLAGYVADAVQMKKIGKTKLALIHPDVANANALKSFIEPSMIVWSALSTATFLSRSAVVMTPVA